MSLSRLRWRARRGMKELDVLFGRWLDQHGQSATPQQLATFEALLDGEDDVLWQWMLGAAAPPDDALKTLVDEIRTGAHV